MTGDRADFGSLSHALERSAAATPERIAVESGGERIGYGEFAAAARRCAGGLGELGVRRGDRVAVALPNGIAAAVALYGALRAGAAIVPLNPGIKGDKLAAILEDCQAKVLIGTAALAAQLPSARAQPLIVAADGAAPAAHASLDELMRAPERGAQVLEVDLAAVIYTSGSTGVPKGVVLSHRNMAFASASICAYLGMHGDDRILSTLPLSFDYGLYQLLLCAHVGASLLLEPGMGYPGELVRMLHERGVTGLPGVPTLFRVLLSLPGLDKRDWPQLRLITNTGAALSGDTIQSLRRIFPQARLYSMYGLTECKRVSYLPPEELDRRPDSVGIAIPGTEVWIEGERGERLRAGEVGELMVRGPHVMQGYWNAPAATAERLRAGRWPWERVLATGDLFRQDAQGFLYFVGRRDDIIKSRGEKVSPREIENVLLAAPGVLDAAVLGVAHEVLGQAIWAHVSPRPGAALDARELDRFCRERLEPHLVPARFAIHAQLPKSANGKIDKRALAQPLPQPEHDHG
ncbi:amino acid adenylation domain-containing protein [Lysobacter sp. yr284]|uniref:class I adenylate-forming enzyme family protein n=1 Tax=Lysobacter sp. yr284 TaxID=1761791 RepID=UPI0008961A3B|nr:class I adenylate-forming enzyme family protein [Lysobacter sp. yr284]SDZ01728.1 amino acid adenylation domain-containing protein [Lysobacter sp. yr284]